MSTLLLKLKAPMQAWGSESRYTTRHTHTEPTKSGVLGLLAAAQGRRRTDPLEDLAELRFGVRVDQPGTLQRDFQTAIDWRTGKSQPLSTRYYLADAIFVAGVEGEADLLERLRMALHSPHFPLFLGRRSCPANHDILIGLSDMELEQALRDERWHASAHHRGERGKSVDLPLYLDGKPGSSGEPRRDVPVSFDPTHRRYGWRQVDAPEPVAKPNAHGREVVDPFFEAVATV